ncbi:MAG: hypothetical protein FVQ81_05450 [Candidatus Glassbacteria bacterium]|nr:hypothetical protein [Candidatus Glassbacteria bacterium]
MEDRKFFGLGGDERVSVELTVQSGGEHYQLVHLFRRPSAADKKRFWAAMGSVPAAEGQDRNLAYLSAQERLYDDSILEVEGYDLKDGGSEDERWWVALVPLEHKLWAVEKLLSEAGNLEPEAVKN